MKGQQKLPYIQTLSDGAVCSACVLRLKGNPVRIRDSRHYCIGECLDAYPIGLRPEKGSRKALPAPKPGDLPPIQRTEASWARGRPAGTAKAAGAPCRNHGIWLFPSRRKGRGLMKHRPENPGYARRVLAFVLSLSLAWCQLPKPAFAADGVGGNLQETAQAAPAQEAYVAGSGTAASQASSLSAKDGDSKENGISSATEVSVTTDESPASGKNADASSEQKTQASAAASGTTTEPAADAGADVAEISVRIRVIGPDAVGNVSDWLAEKTVKIASGKTAQDLTQQAFAGTLTADIEPSAWGAYLDTITSPIDGKAYGSDKATKKYWQLFVDGTPSALGMSQVTLTEGSEIVWYYSAYGASLADAKVVSDPSLEVSDASATRTEGTAEWAGFNQGMQGGAVTAETPTTAAGTALAWNPVQIGMGASDPVLVDGKLYMVSAGTLQVIDSSTGTVLAAKKISMKSGFFCRPVYAEGLLIIPVDDGRLMAYTLYSEDSADSLKLVWETPRIEASGSTQTLSSLTVAGGRVFAAFSVVDWMNPLNGTGYLVSASLNDGSSWQVTTENDEYYWAGAASHGSDIVIADEKGYAYLLSGTDGSEIASVNLGNASHASITKVSDTEYLAVRTDGVLHVLSVQNGTIAETASVKFADRSTSTAVVSGSVAFVGGSLNGSGWPYTGTLSAIDLARVGEVGYVPQTIEIGAGAVQATPLVAQSSSGLSIYVTANSTPGGLFLASYRNGNLSEAQTIFTPESSYQNYCTASPIASKMGLIFYTNDSGYLFALKNVAIWTIYFDTEGGSSMAHKTVAAGTAAGSLDEPTRDGYTFAGWYLDKECMKSFDASFIGEGGTTLTLHAKWTKNAAAPAPRTDADGAAPKTRPARTPAAPSSVPAVQTADESTMTDEAAPVLAQSASRDSSSGGPEDVSAAAAGSADMTGAAQDTWKIAVPIALLALGLFLILLALRRRKQER
jgi:uncharacterized repeat protein (TIGR02543 family)